MARSLDPISRPRSTSYLALLAVLISLAALALVAWYGSRTVRVSEPHVTSRWQEAKRTGILRVGYGGFPPYTIINPNETDPSKRVTGFCVDLVEEIASRTVPKMKVEWQQFSWDSMKGDLATDRFAFIGDAVYLTVPRAADFLFTEPYSYFGIAVALVRSDDNRFKEFKDLDQPGITIALAEGYTSTEYARANLTKPTLKAIPVTGDAFNQLDEVLFGRADVALNDVPTVLQYARAHKDKVKALWLDNPPSTVSAGFVLRPEDVDLKAFLDTSLRTLSADGTIARIDRKWKSLGFFAVPDLRPGAGLKDGN
jgi:cystine transport system substrate-binding protein